MYAKQTLVLAMFLRYETETLNPSRRGSEIVVVVDVADVVLRILVMKVVIEEDLQSELENDSVFAPTYSCCFRKKCCRCRCEVPKPK